MMEKLYAAFLDDKGTVCQIYEMFGNDARLDC